MGLLAARTTSDGRLGCFVPAPSSTFSANRVAAAYPPLAKEAFAILPHTDHSLSVSLSRGLQEPFGQESENHQPQRDTVQHEYRHAVPLQVIHQKRDGEVTDHRGNHRPDDERGELLPRSE